MTLPTDAELNAIGVLKRRLIEARILAPLIKAFAEELGEAVTAPAQMQEFVLAHSDNVEASGFVQHLKLPHYVDFQSELELVRKLRTEHAAKHTNASHVNGLGKAA